MSRVSHWTDTTRRKLTDKFSDLCVMDFMSGGFDLSESVDETEITPLGQTFWSGSALKEAFAGGSNLIFQLGEKESPDTVLAVIKEGYKLPLLTIPESRILAKNKSAIVREALEGLLATNCISVVNTQPWVVNPLTVAVRVEGKKRLVLDLIHVNPHLIKYKFKCEDISTAQQLLGESYYLYTFDIKRAYHHIEIFKSHRTYLGFQWPYQGKLTYFVFNVLPFGLSTAPYIF